MKIKIWVMVLAVALIGCEVKPDIQTCESPSIMIGNECCQDMNNNQLCDDIEIGESKDYVEKPKDASNIEEKIKPKKKYMNVTELSKAINESFFPYGSYNFSLIELENETGFWDTYDVYESDPFRFTIGKIKKEYNFLETEKNFSAFINKRFDLTVRDTNTGSFEYIDSIKMSSYKWEDADFDYFQLLEEFEIDGKKAYFEKHHGHWGIKGELQDTFLFFRVSIWCTPELVVNVYYPDTWWVPYFPGSQVSTNAERFEENIARLKANMTLDAKKIQKVCDEGKPLPPKWDYNYMIFRGKGGFYPPAVTIKQGENVRIYNHNDQYLGTAFTFIRQYPKHKSFNSKGVALGDYTTVNFTEKGEYMMLAAEYSARAKIIVE